PVACQRGLPDRDTHPTHGRPTNAWMALAEFWRDTPRRFADRLNQMNESQSEILVSVVLRSGKTLRLADSLPRHVEHMPDVDEVTLRHREVPRLPRSDCGASDSKTSA